jgi:hypothetical protein
MNWLKNFFYLFKISISQIFFLPVQNFNFNINFHDICGFKKGRTTYFSSPLLLVLFDLGSGINITDLQHCARPDTVVNTGEKNEIYRDFKETKISGLVSKKEKLHILWGGGGGECSVKACWFNSS